MKTVKSSLKLEIDTVCDQIVDGMTYRGMAAHYGVSQLTLHKFLSEQKHSARAREAFIISADSYADKAEQVLLDAKKDSLDLMRARELSQFYKWKAAKRYPKKFGEKLDVTTNEESLNKIPDLTHLSFEQLKELQRGAKASE